MWVATMRIPNINNDITTVPVKNLQTRIQNIRAANTRAEFVIAEIAATTYLCCLNDTGYINAREHFEYQRQIRDERDRKQEALTT